MVGRWFVGTLPPALSNHLKCETPQATIDVKISSWAMAFGFLWKTSASRASSSILQQRNRTCNSSVIIESGLSHRFAINRGFLECLKRSGSVVREEVLSIPPVCASVQAEVTIFTIAGRRLRSTQQGHKFPVACPQRFDAVRSAVHAQALVTVVLARLIKRART